MNDQAHSQTGREGMTSRERRDLTTDAKRRGITHNEMMKEIRDRKRVGQHGPPDLRAAEGVRIDGNMIAVPEAGANKKAANESGFVTVIVFYRGQIGTMEVQGKNLSIILQ